MNYLKSEQIKLTTPRCQFQYSWLVDPDTKFEPASWKVTALIPAESSVEIEKALGELLESWKKQLKSATPDKKFKLANMPFGFESINGEEYFTIRMKRKTGGVRQDGTRWENSPPQLFDANGKPITDKAPLSKLGPGTEGRISFIASGYDNPSQGVGIKIQVSAAQIIKKVDYAPGAQNYGFETEEGWTEEASSTTEAVEANDAGDF